jgi:hypothetical protein
MPRSARKVPTSKIEVWQFKRGNQGEVSVLEVVERAVRKTKLYIPYPNGCASETMVWKTLPLIDYRGERYVVRFGNALGGSKEVDGFIQIVGPAS